jgi:hypothetical protein
MDHFVPCEVPCLCTWLGTIEFGGSGEDAAATAEPQSELAFSSCPVSAQVPQPLSLVPAEAHSPACEVQTSLGS